MHDLTEDQKTSEDLHNLKQDPVSSVDCQGGWKALLCLNNFFGGSGSLHVSHLPSLIDFWNLSMTIHLVSSGNVSCSIGTHHFIVSLWWLISLLVNLVQLFCDLRHYLDHPTYAVQSCTRSITSCYFTLINPSLCLPNSILNVTLSEKTFVYLFFIYI